MLTITKIRTKSTREIFVIDKGKYIMQKSAASSETNADPEDRTDELAELLNDEELSPEELLEWLEKNQPWNDNDNNNSDSIESSVCCAMSDESNGGGEKHNVVITDMNVLEQKSEYEHELLQTHLEIDDNPTDSSLSVDFGLEETVDVGGKFKSLDFPSDIFDGNERTQCRKRNITNEMSESIQQPQRKIAKKDMSDGLCDTNDSLSSSAHDTVCDPSERVSGFESNEYKHAMRKLKASMKRSELTRSRVLRNREFHSMGNDSAVDESTSPQLTTIQSLSDLFTGKRNCLTAGLEASRRQLRKYLSMMSSNQLF